MAARLVAGLLASCLPPGTPALPSAAPREAAQQPRRLRSSGESLPTTAPLRKLERQDLDTRGPQSSVAASPWPVRTAGPSARRPRGTPRSSAAPLRRLDRPSSEACSQECVLHGETASCAARMQWAAINEFPGQEQACKLGYGLVLEECPHCAGCPLEDIGCLEVKELKDGATGCQATCVLDGAQSKTVATCEERVRWTAENDFAERPDACSAAFFLVQQQCSACAGCTKAQACEDDASARNTSADKAKKDGPGKGERRRPAGGARKGCADTDNGATNRDYGVGCEGYTDLESYYCGSFDDSDFSSFDMCCVCGGGTEASPEDEQNAEAGKDAPFFDDHGDTGVYIRARSLLCSAELIGDRFVDNREDCEAFCTQNKHCAGYSWEDSSLHCLLTRDPGVIQGNFSWWDCYAKQSWVRAHNTSTTTSTPRPKGAGKQPDADQRAGAGATSATTTSTSPSRATRATTTSTSLHRAGKAGAIKTHVRRANIPLEYNCSSGRAHPSNWSHEKREFCCSAIGVGCKPTETTVTSTSTLTGTSTPTDTSTLTVTSSETAITETSGTLTSVSTTTSLTTLPFNCSAGARNMAAGWSAAKLVWCCKHEGTGCPTTTTTASSTTTSLTETNSTSITTTTTGTETATSASMTNTSHTITTTATRTSSATSASMTNTSGTSATLTYTSGTSATLTNTTFSSATVTFTITATTQTSATFTSSISSTTFTNTSTTALPYDCVVQTSGQEVSWSLAQKAWCCAREKVGCSRPTVTATTTMIYDCTVGFMHWSELWDGGWSIGQKTWCCQHKGVACQNSSKRALSQEDAPASFTSPTSTTTAPSPTTAAPLFNCSAGVLNWRREWSDGKKSWCCSASHGGAGCTTSVAEQPTADPVVVLDRATEEARQLLLVSSMPGKESSHRADAARGVPDRAFPEGPLKYDCFGSWQQDWGREQKAWCCEHVGWGCDQDSTTPPQVDCDAAVDQWELEWSHWKKQWCCRQAGIGCPTNSSAAVSDAGSLAAAQPVTVSDATGGLQQAARQRGLGGTAVAVSLAIACASAVAALAWRRHAATRRSAVALQALPRHVFTRLSAPGCAE